MDTYTVEMTYKNDYPEFVMNIRSVSDCHGLDIWTHFTCPLTMVTLGSCYREFIVHRHVIRVQVSKNDELRTLSCSWTHAQETDKETFMAVMKVPNLKNRPTCFKCRGAIDEEHVSWDDMSLHINCAKDLALHLGKDALLAEFARNRRVSNSRMAAELQPGEYPRLEAAEILAPTWTPLMPHE